MGKFEVWMEGHRATGEHSTADYLGVHEGENFKEACKNALEAEGWSMGFYDGKTNSYWGCRFFDNEADAREGFG